MSNDSFMDIFKRYLSDKLLSNNNSMVKNEQKKKESLTDILNDNILYLNKETIEQLLNKNAELTEYGLHQSALYEKDLDKVDYLFSNYYDEIPSNIMYSYCKNINHNIHHKHRLTNEEKEEKIKSVLTNYYIKPGDSLYSICKSDNKEFNKFLISYVASKSNKHGKTSLLNDLCDANADVSMIKQYIHKTKPAITSDIFSSCMKLNDPQLNDYLINYYTKVQK